MANDVTTRGFASGNLSRRPGPVKKSAIRRDVVGVVAPELPGARIDADQLQPELLRVGAQRGAVVAADVEDEVAGLQGRPGRRMRWTLARRCATMLAFRPER